MVTEENPYEPLSTDISAGRVSPSSKTTSLASRVRVFVTVSLVVVAFALLGYWGIKLFLEKQWLISFVAVSFALMLIPMVDQASSLRQRLAVSLVILFAFAGLVSFVGVYFFMFRFPWFESIFNGKDTGPLGLIVFAIFGLVVGGTVGCRLIQYCFKSSLA